MEKGHQVYKTIKNWKRVVKFIDSYLYTRALTKKSVDLCKLNLTELYHVTDESTSCLVTPAYR